MRVVRAGTTAWLSITGELDLATAPAVRSALRRLTREQGLDGLVLDLRQVSFVDLRGVKLTLYAVGLAQTEGIGISILPPPSPLDRVFDLAGVGARLPFVQRVAAGRVLNGYEPWRTASRARDRNWPASQ